MDHAVTFRDRRAFVVLAIAFGALAPVAVYARLGTVVLLVLTLAAQPCWGATKAALLRLARSPLTWFGAALTLWAAITLFWAPAPEPIDIARVAIVPLMGLLLVAAVRDLPQAHAERLAQVVVVSAFAMLALLGLEVLSEGAILRLVVPAPDILPPGQTSPVVEHAARGAAVIAPLAYVFAYLISTRTGRARTPVLFVVATFLVCKATSMDAAWVAILAGGVALGVTYYAPRVALVGLFGGLMLYAAAAPLISSTVLTLDGIDNLAAAGMSGTYSRIGIWQEAARRIAEHPLIGHGFDATRVLGANTGLIPGTKWPALPLHTHNAFLQVWLELGVVGIALVIAMLAAGMRALWPLAARPLALAVALATLTGTAVIALISFGVWQHWWLATWMLAAALTQLALRIPLSSLTPR